MKGVESQLQTSRDDRERNARSPWWRFKDLKGEKTSVNAGRNMVDKYAVEDDHSTERKMATPPLVD